MNHLGCIAAISPIGSAMGIVALMCPWVSGLNGIDLLEGSVADPVRLVPVLVMILSVIEILLSSTYFLSPRWFIPFITFFLGVATLILTSVLAMSTVDGVKVGVETGAAISYMAGIIVLFGSAMLYKMQFRPAIDNSMS
jgi:hypothetical protein